MISRHKYKLLFCTIWFIASCSFGVTLDIALSLLLAILFPFIIGAFLLSVVHVFRAWPREKYLSLTPLFVVVLSVTTPIPIGTEIGQQIFKYRLPQYESMVTRIKSIKIQDNNEYIKIPALPNEEHLSLHTNAVINKGVYYIEFLKAGSYAGHFGYIYSSSGEVPPDSVAGKRDRHLTRVNGSWFEFSDSN